MTKTSCIPNIITLAGIFAGFTSIIASINNNYMMASYFILLAFLFDGLDGKTARLLHAESALGLQLDSLADTISFGVAPAILAYQYVLCNYNIFGLLTAYFFIVCGVLRLARFNISSKHDSSVFIGLPIPAAACAIASCILFLNNPSDSIVYSNEHIFFIIFINCLSFLMVTNLHYPSIKKVDFLVHRQHLVVMFILLIFLVVSLYYEFIMFILFLIYILSGIMLSFLHRRDEYPTSEDVEEVK